MPWEQDELEHEVGPRTVGPRNYLFFLGLIGFFLLTIYANGLTKIVHTANDAFLEFCGVHQSQDSFMVYQSDDSRIGVFWAENENGTWPLQNEIRLPNGKTFHKIKEDQR